MLPHPTFFVKLSIYNRFGLYNTDLKKAADYEMILKLLYKHNISVFYIPMILVNGTEGIGTGFSTKIPCYHPQIPSILTKFFYT